MLYLVLFFLTKSQSINETEKITVRENKYARKLVFDDCAKINTRESVIENNRIERSNTYHKCKILLSKNIYI